MVARPINGKNLEVERDGGGETGKVLADKIERQRGVLQKEAVRTARSQ